MSPGEKLFQILYLPMVGWDSQHVLSCTKAISLSLHRSGVCRFTWLFFEYFRASQFICSSFFLLVGVKREAGANAGNVDAAGRRDAQFRRTSSCNDADVLETSFSDMLKSSAKKPAPQETHVSAAESSDGMMGARNNKKKGKKGRQIDPALLGFKVTSNRIMMGEIQRIED